MKKEKVMTITISKTVDSHGWKQSLGLEIHYYKKCEKYFKEVAELLEFPVLQLKHYDDDKKVGKNGRKKV